MKRNYKMKISYDGTRYYGWEHQPGQEMTIQGKLESVLTRMLEGENVDRPAAGDKEFCAADAGTGVSKQTKSDHGTDALETEMARSQPVVTVIGAGRTDAGVHAREMTANVLLDTYKSEAGIQAYLNRYLPDDISVNEVKICADRFHSRFKAKGKTYCYTCWYAENGEKPIFDRKYVNVLDRKPDVERMRKAAEELIGMHDFKSFCGNSHMKKSTVRVVDSIAFKTHGPYIRMYIHGSGFLQNMVRIIMGTLLEVGYGKREPSDMAKLLEAKDRKQAGPTAPAQGLCLQSVDY